jgi:hypothetical protein
MSATASVSGADPEALDRAAAEFRSAADDLERQAVMLTASLRSTMWVGGAATSFVARWDAGHRRGLDTAAAHLRDAAARLGADASDQRRVSASPAPVGGSGSWVALSTDGVDPERVHQVLRQLGLARGELDAAAAAAQRIGHSTTADGILDLLTDDSFSSFLDASRHVIDVGLFATDLLVDIGEHPDLALDEQLVHGVADAGLRLAAGEGVEAGVEFIAGALTAALVPALGVVFAPLVSQLAGAVASSLVAEVVAAVDEATDVVDWVADRAVDVYREIKGTLGLVVDLLEPVTAVVGGTADLAGDVGDWLVDGVGDGVRDVGGAIGSVGGWISGKVGG